MKFKTIAIVGLGLMGGSLAARCRRKYPRARIVGISRSSEALRFARRHGWIHEGTKDLRQGVSQTDLVVLCTPVDTLPPFLTKIDCWAKEGTLVTDVGSVKNKVASWQRRHPLKRIYFVAGHPMVGSHERGIYAASADLYSQGYTFVVRPSGPRKAGYREIKAFWQRISGRVVEVDAGGHDQIVAAISHLPHLIAAALVNATERQLIHFSGPGFRDTTRIAQGSPLVWEPIFLANQKAILGALKKFEKELKLLAHAVASTDGRLLRNRLQQAALQRRQI